MVNSNAIDANIANSFSDITGQVNQKVKQDDSLKQGSPIVGKDTDVEKVELLEQATPPKLAEQDKALLDEEDAKLKEAYETVSEFMHLYNRNVNFSLADDSDIRVIKVFDADSKELIKQFPSEDLIKLAKKIDELRQDIDISSGIFLDEKV